MDSADGSKIRDALIKAADHVESLQRELKNREQYIICLLTKVGGTAIIRDDELLKAADLSYTRGIREYSYGDIKEVRLEVSD